MADIVFDAFGRMGSDADGYSAPITELASHRGTVTATVGGAAVALPVGAKLLMVRSVGAEGYVGSGGSSMAAPTSSTGFLVLTGDVAARLTIGVSEGGGYIRVAATA